ncbi:MAG: M57 family metalloprotease, partial [Chitinophagaceae bacterium]
MKTNNFLKAGFVVGFIFFSLITYGQEPKTCGPYKINTEALNKALQFEKSGAAQNTLASTVLIRVYFHIATDNDGSNAAATTDQLKEEFNTLASNYAADNLCFLYAGVNYINSSFLNNNFNADVDSSSDFDTYQVPNCINIFYMKKINGSNASCGGSCGYGGIALGGIPGTYCLIASGNIARGQTITHEVGHCMGLLHTFEPANGYEDIDGSNSSTSADLIADTPADPYVFKNLGNSCFSRSSDSCKYTGTCTDPKGQTNFSPPYTNLMAYWWANSCYFSLQITGNQFTRINSFLSTNSSLKQCETTIANANIYNINVSSGYYFASAVNTLNSGDNVNISGTAISTLGAGNIIINPGFHATPSGNGLVLVRVDQCG